MDVVSFVWAVALMVALTFSLSLVVWRRSRLLRVLLINQIV